MDLIGLASNCADEPMSLQTLKSKKVFDFLKILFCFEMHYSADCVLLTL